MANDTTLTSQPESRDYRGFSYWMERALNERERLLEEESSSGEAVHDLRVALRRCRSIAEVMAEVDPDPGWRAIRKAAKRLFHALGDLRDAQVIDEWAEKLSGAEDPVRARLRTDFESAEPELRDAVQKSVRKFDEKEWKRLERHLRSRARWIPPGSAAAECLTLERLEAALELHQRALRSEKARPWHELRIGIKRFRYTSESLLPEQYAAWSDNLKRLQDLLGDVHDLDVLQGLAEKAEAREGEESRSIWQETITRERKQRVATYRQLTLGKTSLWNTWHAGLPSNGRLEAAILARFRAMGRAVDPHPRRTSQLSRIALGVFDVLDRASVMPGINGTGSPATRQMLRIAARLHPVLRASAERKRSKTGTDALLRFSKPPGWSAEEWTTLAWTMRYERGSEPKSKHRRFLELAASQQKQVRLLAGVLRLARALRKSGVQTGAGIRCEICGSALVLRVPKLADSAEISARVGAGKHLLEGYLGKPLSVYPAAKAEPILMRAPSNQHAAAASEPLLPFAEASD